MSGSSNSADLNIVLKLIDQATAQLNKAMAEVEKTANKTGQQGQKAGDSFANGFKKANAQIRDFRRMMMVGSIAVAGIVATTREWANQNEATHTALTSLGNNLKTISGNIGSLFAPAIMGINDALNAVMPNLTAFFEKARQGFDWLTQKITYGTQYVIAYFASLNAGATETEAMAAAAVIAGGAAEDMGNKFKAAFAQDTTAQVNAMEESVKNLRQTYDSWMGDVSQEKMIDLTIQTAQMQQIVSARQQYYTTVAQMDQLANDQELQRYLQMTAQKKQALDDLTKATTMTTRQQLSVTVGALGQLESALAGAEEMGKGFAKAAAAVSLAMAIINTAQGVTKALAEYPWPFSLVVAGIVAAAGAIQVATIASTKFAEGTDTVPAMLSPGETVIPRSFASAIRAGDLTLSGPRGSGVTSNSTQVNIDIKVDRPVVSQASDIDYLVEEVSRRVAQEVERIR